MCSGNDVLCQHLSAISGQRWKAFRDVDESIQEAFRACFLRFRPDYDVEKVFVLSLGKISDLESQQLTSPGQTVDGHDTGDLRSA